jgi:cysteine-rich repeat protein
MVTRSRERLFALTMGAQMLGCNALAGIREGVFDPCVEDAGDPACATGGGSSSSSSGGGGEGTSASATTSGTGGGRAKCGDGKLDVDEECDDKNTTAHDGCTSCKVDCAEAKAFKDPGDAHCYWSLPDATSFLKSSVMCESFPGGQLATVTSPHELALIASHLGGPVWIGASALGPSGTLAWLDGEPWDYVVWGPGEPSQGSKDLCLLLEGEPLRFGMSDCALSRRSLCERAPAAVTP